MTVLLLAGAASFGLMTLSDALCVFARRPAARGLFVVGQLLLVLATALLLWRTGAGAPAAQPLRLLWLPVLGAGAFALCDTLFFALPAGGSGLLPPKATGLRPLIDTGMFALCRHPGVLWLGLVYLALWGLLGGSALLWAFMLFFALDVLYVLWQDIWLFPRSIAGYAAYRQRTPFLVPTPRSVRAGIASFRR